MVARPSLVDGREGGAARGCAAGDGGIRGRARAAEHGGSACLRPRHAGRTAGDPGRGVGDPPPGRAAGRVRPLGHHERGGDGRDADADQHARTGAGRRGRARRRRRATTPTAWCGWREALAAALPRGRLRRARIGRVGPALRRLRLRRRRRRTRLRAATGIEPVRIEAAELREPTSRSSPARVAELEPRRARLYDVAPRRRGRDARAVAARACALDDLVGGTGSTPAGSTATCRRSGSARSHRHHALLRPRPPDVPRHPVDVRRRRRDRRGDADAEAARRPRRSTTSSSRSTTRPASSGRQLGRARPALRPAERPALVRNHWFARDPRCGACAASARPPARPPSSASRLDAPEPGLPLVVAPGEFTARRWPATGTVYAASASPAAPRRGLDALVPRGSEPPLGGDAGRPRAGRRDRRTLPRRRARSPSRASASRLGPVVSDGTTYRAARGLALVTVPKTGLVGTTGSETEARAMSRSGPRPGEDHPRHVSFVHGQWDSSQRHVSPWDTAR